MIYVIQAGNEGHLKIGYAVDPQKRIRQLQTANSERLRILKIVPGARQLEKQVHRDLASFRRTGEWFDAAPEVLKYVANLSAAEYELDGGKPYLVLWRETERSPTEYCPFCGYRHTHGIGDGHRVPHCVSNDGLAVASDGTRLYQQSGYIVRTRTVGIESRAWKSQKEQDSIAQFFEKHCEINQQGNHRTFNSDLYGTYKKFCDANGKYTRSHRRLTQYLIQRGVRQRNSGGRFWEGLRLL